MDIPVEFKSVGALERLLTAQPAQNINCHKAVLYLAGMIPLDALVSDPREQQDADFTFKHRALEMSHKVFVSVADVDGLLSLAENEVHGGTIYIGQILDVQDHELAHSFLITKDRHGAFLGIDKVGFKEPFSSFRLESLLDFDNYQNQKWRFVPLDEVRQVPTSSQTPAIN